MRACASTQHLGGLGTCPPPFHGKCRCSEFANQAANMYFSLAYDPGWLDSEL